MTITLIFSYLDLYPNYSATVLQEHKVPRKTGPAYLVLLNELTLWRVLWLAIRGRRVCCIPVPTIFGQSSVFLRKAVGWLAKHFAVRDVLDFDPRLEKYKLRLPAYRDDPFRRAEPWLDPYIGHSSLDIFLHDDAMPLRHATCMVFDGYLRAIWLAHWFSVHYRSENAVFIGLDPILSGTYHEIYGTEPALPSVHFAASKPWLNVLLAAAAAAAVVVHAFRCVRLSPEFCRDIFLGSDFSGHPRDVTVWNEIADEGHEVMVVFRNKKQHRTQTERICDFQCTVPGEGEWSVMRAWKECGEALRRLRPIWRAAHGLVPALAFQGFLLPLRRLKMRQLLTRYRFKNFWVRDDYSVDHIIRSQEIRRTGGKSIGVAHGLPLASALVPLWRYIDCDVYLVQGLGILRQYGDRWAPWMKVVASGSLGMTRELESRLATPRPHDIIFQAKPTQGSEPLLAVLEALARAFPDRKILMQFKGYFRESSFAESFRQVARHHHNVTETNESIYELFLRARYLITDPSTVAAEAIQFGLYAFMVDYDGRESLYFRDYPEFCENSPDELVRRIRGIEDGSYVYRFTDYDALINRRGHFPNQFRVELGLRPQITVSNALYDQPCVGS